mgnify:CR=1 FL=1
MSQLSPTQSQPSRNRASSVSVRPTLTLTRRRSTTGLNGVATGADADLDVLPAVPATPSPPQDLTIVVPTAPAVPVAVQNDSPPSMLEVVASRILTWFHRPTQHTVVDWSAPSSPRSSTDEFVLPVSASTQESFVIPLVEKPSAEQSHWTSHLSVRGSGLTALTTPSYSPTPRSIHR